MVAENQWQSSYSGTKVQKKCMTLHGDVQQCTSLYGIVHHHIGVAQKRIQRYSTTPYRHGIMTTVDQIADQSTNKR